MPVGGTIFSAWGLHPARYDHADGRGSRTRFSVACGLLDFREAMETLEAGQVSPRAIIGATVKLYELPERFDSMR